MRIAISCSSARPLVLPGPPPSYDHKKHILARSISIIEEKYPKLLHLARDGTVIAIPRPSTYVERRSDGYMEPELVLIVGTAHLSASSADDVFRVVTEVRPQNVVVELCRSRSAQLYDDENEINLSEQQQQKQQKWIGSSAKRTNPLSLSGNNLLQAYQRSIALGGRSALILRLLLSNLSQQLSKDLSISSGVEFRAARQAADRINAQVVLGDRPIEITLQRAWQSLSWRERWNLLKDLTAGIKSSDGTTTASSQDVVETIEKMKDDDAVTAMLTYFGERYPHAVSPLVHERDVYLAWSLKRSKAVNGTETVVGVIGKGHIRGVVYALTHDDGQLRFRDLAGSRNGKKDGIKDGISKFIIETGVFVGVVWIWNYVVHMPQPL